MTPVETELIRVLDEAAPEPPEGSGPREFGNVPRRRWVLPAAAAAAVLVIAAVAVALSRAHSHGEPASGSDQNPPESTGMVAVGYYGVTITVPKSFTVGPVMCVPPTRDAVVPDTGEIYRCPMLRGVPPQPRGLTIVYLQPTSRSTGDVHADRRTTVDGVPALTGDGYDPHGRPTSILVIARNNVAVEVTAPTFDAAHRMLQRVHIAPVDTRGCSDRKLPAIGNPQTSTILPGKPISAIACEYSTTHRLLGSGRLSPVLLRHAVRVLQHAQPSIIGIPFHTVLVTYIFRYANGTERAITSDLDTYPFIATDGRHAVRLSAELPRVYQ